MGTTFNEFDPLAAFLACVNQIGLAEYVNVFHHAETTQLRKSFDDLRRRSGGHAARG